MAEQHDVTLSPDSLSNRRLWAFRMHQRFIKTYHGEGVRVKLRRLTGITRPGVLREDYRFQCAPLDQFTVQHGHTHSEYTTIGKRTYTHRDARQLRVAALNSLIVPWGDYVTWIYFNQERLVTELRNLSEWGTPFQFEYWHTWDDYAVAFKATLRDFQVEERAGEPDTFYVSGNFTEWLDPVVNRRAQGKEWPKYHKLTTKDTLYSLSKRYYGKPSLAWQIAAHNHDLKKWGKNTPIHRHKKWKPGDKVKIPAPPAPRARIGIPVTNEHSVL